MAKRQVLTNCHIEADDNGSHAALVQDLGPSLESVAILLKKGWRNGERVKVTVELVKPKARQHGARR